MGEPRAVYLVRHGAKAGEVLSALGKQQAETLAGLLADAGISTIYTTQFQRTKDMAAPLVALLAARGVNVRQQTVPLPQTLLNHPDDPEIADAYGRDVAKEIRAESSGEVVLVVGHDATIPPIIAAMGYDAATTVATTDFDRLFIVIPREGRPPGLFQLLHYAP